MPFVLSYKNLGKANVNEVGGKGANLAELINAGFPVPPVFFITVEAYEKFAEENELKPRIMDIIGKIDFSDVNSIKNASDQIQNLILNARMPLKIQAAILDAYKKMSYDKELGGFEFIKAGTDMPYVAVRSSGVVEDIKTASSAGQYETFLNVRGEKNLMLSVMKCWASLYTPRVIYYRYKHNQPQDTSICVIIQKMINSDRAGVAFTVDPMNPVEGKHKIIIEACWGLGETLVQGQVEPDYYVVDKQTGKILSKKIGEKKLMRTRDIYSGTTVKKDVPRDKIKKQVLSDNEIVILAAYCKKVENHYKFPQDIEWASEKGKLYILQTRSVTTLKEKRTKAVIGTPILIGLGASPGVATGKVRLVHDISEIDKLEKGEILVTTMTNPDMVPIMEKSAAIITDQGGATCFSGDTKILTDKGFMTMKDIDEKIESGENIKTLSVNKETLKTEWKQIKKTMKRRSNVWKVSVSQTGRSKHNVLKVTPDHKMLTFDKRKLIKRKMADLMNNNEFICLIDKIPSICDNEISYTNNGKDLAYLAGSMFSDGYIDINQRRGRVIFTQKNIESKRRFIETVQDSFQNMFNYNLKDIGEQISAGNIRGRDFVGSSNKYVCSRKVPAIILNEMQKNISDIVLKAPNEILIKYISGIIDGDGSFGTPKSGRVHIYNSKEHVIESIVIACLRLGISPQISINRDNCYNIQVVEKIKDILKNTNRVNGEIIERVQGTKMFSAKQLFSDIVDKVNYKGRIKPYVNGNLLIDGNKIGERILHLADKNEKEEIEKIIKSDLRMQRVRKVEEMDIQDVYNIEVKDNNNYIVFSKMYSPILVNNCHAAIVSRELGVPAIVGTRIATEILKQGQTVTVDATHGKVFSGEVEIVVEKPKEYTGDLKTKTLIKANLAFPETAEKGLHADGVGLLRLEHMLTKHGYHPMEYIRQEKQEELINIIVEGVGKVAETFYPKPVWIRSLDARTDEYRNMIGGENEPEESNPMLGWHGIRRSLDDVEIMKSEFEAIKRLYEKGLDNIGIMISFTYDASEFVQAKKIAKEVGLPDKIKFGVMVEVPSCALSIEEYCKAGIDFVSFGSNDLTQLTLGVDRNNEKLIKLFDEMHLGMRFLFAYVIEVCKKHNVESSICGEAPSNRRDIVEYLVKLGITSLSVNIDAIDKVRQWVAEIEG